MKKILFAISLFYFSFANSQITFEKGYFISNDGKRTDCYIKNVDWKDNPVNFEYTINQEDTNINTESIANVSLFEVENSHKFKRQNVAIERSSNDIKFFTKNKNPIWKQEVLFLKVLVEGDATLYSYTEGNLYKYFYETQTTPIAQLVRIKYYGVNGEDINVDENIKENNQFRQQLLNSLSASNLSENDFKNLKYDKGSLVAVFTKYNANNLKSFVNYDEKKKKKKIGFKLIVGIDQASVSISDPNKFYNYSTDIKGEIVLKLGGEIEFTMPFNKNKWSLFFNPMYQKYSAEKTYINNDGFGATGSNVTNNVKINYTALQLIFGVRHYMFLNSSSKFFIDVAFVPSFGGKATFDFKNNAGNNPKTFESDTRSNFALGAGYTYKNKYSLALRFNTPKEIIGAVSWSGKYSAIGVLIGYQFN